MRGVHLGKIYAPRGFHDVFNLIHILQSHGGGVKRLAKGRDEARERAPGSLCRKMYIFTQGYCRGHCTVVYLAEVEDEAACDDGRDAKEGEAVVSIGGLG